MWKNSTTGCVSAGERGCVARELTRAAITESRCRSRSLDCSRRAGQKSRMLSASASLFLNSLIYSNLWLRNEVELLHWERGRTRPHFLGLIKECCGRGRPLPEGSAADEGVRVPSMNTRRIVILGFMACGKTT